MARVRHGKSGVIVGSASAMSWCGAGGQGLIGCFDLVFSDFEEVGSGLGRLVAYRREVGRKVMRSGDGVAAPLVGQNG